MNKKSGFTLVELIIVIVIIGILSIIAVPIYRGQIRKSLATEAKALLSEVSASQEIYKARTGAWYDPAGSGVQGDTDCVTAIGVDARRNQYFNAFNWKVDNTTNGDGSMTIFTTGVSGGKAEGMTLWLIWTTDAPQVISETGF